MNLKTSESKRKNGIFSAFEMSTDTEYIGNTIYIKSTKNNSGNINNSYFNTQTNNETSMIDKNEKIDNVKERWIAVSPENFNVRKKILPKIMVLQFTINKSRFIESFFNSLLVPLL